MIKTVVIDEGITSIGSYAFYRCSSLTSVEIPEDVTSIGQNAFQDCTALTSVTIPDSVTSIGQSAFQGCDKLASVTIGSGVKTIGDNAFNNCTSLNTVTYNGSNWSGITIGTGNDPLTNAYSGATASLSFVRYAAAPSYVDVPSGVWYAEAVEYCREKGWMNGTTATTFSPDAPLTRAMLVTILHRMAGKPPAAEAASFSDVDAVAWCAGAVAWASGEKLVLGFADGTFRPNASVTHKQARLIFQRYGGSGVQITGAEAPDSPATRAEIAAALMEFAERQTLAPGEMSVFSVMNIMCGPSGIAADKDGSLLVTDVYNKKVWRVLNRASRSYAGGATMEDLYGRPMGGYNDAGLENSFFKEPWAIAPFLDGWAMTDTENNVVRLVRSDGVQTLNGITQEKQEVTDLGVKFDHPTGLAADGEGNLYVADTFTGAVRKVTPKGGVSTVVEDLSEPTGLCWKDGALYIAETGANRIVKVADGKLTLLAGTGEAALTEGAAEKAAFSGPQGVAVGEDGSVYVADTGNGAVRKLKDGQVTTLIFRDPKQAENGLTSPVGLLVQDGKLYICDTFARKVFVYQHG